MTTMTPEELQAAMSQLATTSYQGSMSEPEAAFAHSALEEIAQIAGEVLELLDFAYTGYDLRLRSADLNRIEPLLRAIAGDAAPALVPATHIPHIVMSAPLRGVHFQIQRWTPAQQRSLGLNSEYTFAASGYDQAGDRFSQDERAVLHAVSAACQMGDLARAKHLLIEFVRRAT